MPGIGAGLECGGLPRGFLALAVEIVAEEWSLDIFAKFAGGFVAGEGNQADTFGFRRLPLTVKPRAGDHEIGVIGIVFFGVTEDLPGAPGIFLVKEAGDV